MLRWITDYWESFLADKSDQYANMDEYEGALWSINSIAQSAGAVKCTDCIPAMGWDPCNEWSGYDTKQYDGEVPVMLEIWGMWIIPSLLSLSGPLESGVVEPDRVLSMGQLYLC